MLRELNVVEQRYRAVLEVLSGIPVIEVAERYGVARQTLHRWMARYRGGRNRRPGRPVSRAEAPSVADRRWGGGGDLRAAPIPPAVGAPAGGVRAGPSRPSGGGPVHGLPGPGPSSAARAGFPANTPGAVTPLGAVRGGGAGGGWAPRPLG